MSSFKPGNFFLALFDFLGIFVPGAVLLFILLDVKLIHELIQAEFVFDEVSTNGQRDSAPAQSGFTQLKTGAAFFFGAYFLGHMAYFLGSLFLDRVHEKWLRTSSFGLLLDKYRQSTLLMRRNIKQYIVSKIQTTDFNKLCNRQPEDKFYGEQSDDSVWRFANCIAVGENDSAAGYLERTRAESRFFRTITVVLFIGTLIFLLKWLHELFLKMVYENLLLSGNAAVDKTLAAVDPATHLAFAVICFGFALLSWMRFTERRLKHEAETYNYFISVVTGPWKPESPPGPWPEPPPLSRGGTIRNGRGRPGLDNAKRRGAGNYQQQATAPSEGDGEQERAEAE